MSLFRRKKKTEEKVVPNPATMEASTAEEYENRGMLFYSHQQYEQAVADFQQAISLRPEGIDPHFSLALTYKAMNENGKAISEFNQVIALLDKGALADDPDRTQMLRRISKAHVQSLKSASNEAQMEESEA